MQLTKPVYTWNEGGTGLTIQYNSECCEQALNFTGPTWVDHRLGLVKALLRTHPVVVTDNDLVAHDDYIEVLKERQPLVVLVFNGQASILRLHRAEAKLRDAGIKVRYFASLRTMTNFVAKLALKVF